jgi:2-polyprenyl-3-methyl-5-hydroxy-6-metoxy-1,4-benzoquinol methylase
VAPINKTMDRDDLETPQAREVVRELDELVRELRNDDLRISSWYGTLELSDDPRSIQQLNRGHGYEPLEGAVDDHFFPWFLYWEIAWLTLNNDFRSGERLLDLGGCSSLFACYVASKGLKVVALDLNQELVENGDLLAAATGWSMRNLRMDLRELDLPGRFDHITSVCVFEHLPVSGRIEVNGRVRDLLNPGGSLSITFDYLNPSRLARINSPADIEEQFVRPSGLRVRGNREFHDNHRRYLVHAARHPRAPAAWRRSCIEDGQFTSAEAETISDDNEYTFGSLFMEKA